MPEFREQSLAARPELQVRMHLLHTLHGATGAYMGISRNRAAPYIRGFRVQSLGFRI